MGGIVDGGGRSYDETKSRRPYVVAGLVLAVGAIAYARAEGDAGSRFELSPERSNAYRRPTTRPSNRHARAEDAHTGYLNVTLDPSGRPDDRSLRQGGSVSRRPLTVPHAPSRRVLFLGGESVPGCRRGRPRRSCSPTAPGVVTASTRSGAKSLCGRRSTRTSSASSSSNGTHGWCAGASWIGSERDRCRPRSNGRLAL
jgi:hypothetical protein